MDVPLLQHIDTTVESQLRSYAGNLPSRHHNKQHEDCMTKYNETEMDTKLRSAQFRTENKKHIVFDSESPSDLPYGIRCKQVSRVVRCATLTARAKTVVRRRCSRFFPGGTSEPFHRSGSSSAPWSATSTFLCQRRASQSESSNRSSMCLCHCRFWKRPSQ